ncbi:ATP-binding protein [Vibrio aquaticus]|uniref:ATP-binding protein n=1 Tax=Vibrio aquaticus TaxID=2496559 RepID=A0A432CYA2_9VIBR|nr:ATP-binding protein [Vibrio aquaticus]RTZ16833.1 ATP-binding protein [Vibrio aquaticus]
MRSIIRLLLLSIALMSSFSYASWEYDFQPMPEAKQVASDIAEEVSHLPEPLFMTAKESRKVTMLLTAVIQEQNKQRLMFSDQLRAYRSEGGEEAWFEVESSYLTLNSLALSKQHLLELTDTTTRDHLTGFGPYGVTQFKHELLLTQLNAQYLLHFQLRSFKALLGDVLISPIPVIWAGFKVLFIYFGLVWWLANNRRLIALFKEAFIDSTNKPPFWVRIIWYLSSANRAIAWLIAITLSLRVLSAIPSLQHLIFLEIFTWWILGGSIAISFILELTYRHSRSTSPEVVALRLSTIRRYVWSIIVAGVILQISMRTLGKGTIYYWIYSALFFWFVLVTISVLRLWREKVFNTVEHISERPVWVQWAVARKDSLLLSIVATATAIAWLITHVLKHKLVAALSSFSFFSQALAYLFRIEVAKQTNGNNQQSQLVRVRGGATFNYVQPGNFDSTLIEYANDEIKQLSQYLLSDSPAVCVLSGERGVGTTTALRTLLNKVKNAEPIYLSCPYAGYKELLAHLAVSIGLDEESSEIQVLAHLRKSDTTYLIAIDNAQRLVKPMVGGLAELIRITNLLRRSRKNHRVVFGIEKASWRFVDRARGERLLFDLVSFLPRWSEKQIGQLLDTRINQTEAFPLSFDGLMVPKQWDQDECTEEERAKQGFYRILWHYSDGNPTVALRFFRFSLQKDKETQQVYVRLFKAPESQELEKMPKPMLAVLRSIVQLEIASPEVLSDCTQLTIAEITGTLRYFQSRGYIEWTEDQARISDHWFRHITNVLDRQHLLVK